MAKIAVKVRIKKTRTAKETFFTWPIGYDSVKFNIVAYEEPDETITSRASLIGEQYEWCLAVVEQADGELAASLHPQDFVLVDQVTANGFGQTCKPQIEKILNEKKVLEVVKKIRDAAPLTAVDSAVIDPANPEPGINYSKVFNVQEWLT